MRFIGVWDTVESLVLHAGKRFHDATLHPDVAFGYHALAIDEKRRDFPPCLWDEANAVPGQTIEQVWFAGSHSDVGGWYDERGPRERRPALDARQSRCLRAADQ